MNFRRTQIMNALRSTYCLLMAILFFAAGCSTPKPGPNPLVGWTLLPSRDPNKVDRAIRDDYQDYIQKLPVEERSHAGEILFFEDGTGRNAVSISIPLNGNWWEHVLIYDENNRRVQAIKRFSGHYGDRWW